MDVNNRKEASKIKGIAWAMFAATGTLCAFLLPAFIIRIYLESAAKLKILYTFDGPLKLIFNILFFSLIIAALYSSIYRIKASNHDLKLGRSFVIWAALATAFIIIVQ